MAKIKLTDLYVESFANWISRGAFVNRDTLSSIGIKTVYNKIITKNYTKKIWYLVKTPNEQTKNMQKYIVGEMKKSHPKVKVQFHTYSRRSSASTRSEAFKIQKKSAANRYFEYKKRFDSLREDDKASGKTFRNRTAKISINKETLDKYRNKYNSFVYMEMHEKNGGTFTRTHCFLELLIPPEEHIDKIDRDLNDIILNLDMTWYPVNGTVSEFLSNFGVSSTPSDEALKLYNSQFLSDMDLAVMLPYDQPGVVGSRGFFIGMNIESYTPFKLNFTESSAGQITLILGKTGSGKSYSAFQIALSAVGDDIHGSAIDIKGKEWPLLSRYMPMKVIDMSGKNGYFVNTLRLDDLNVTRENSYEFYNMALTGTVNIFKLLTKLSDQEGNEVDLNSILNKAVTKLYDMNDITPDAPRTFKYTRELRYEDVLPHILELSMSTSYTDNQRHIANLAFNRIGESLSRLRRGVDGNKMEKELTVADILDTPFITYSLNKNSDGNFDDFESLQIFQIQFLDNKKQSIRKAQGLQTVAFYEELQRCKDFGHLLRVISHAVTGSRSNNVSIFLLMNALSAFEHPDMAQIKSNITTVICGKLNRDDRATMEKSFGFDKVKDKLYKICEIQSYEHCFLALYDVGSERNDCMFKVHFPPDMEEHLRTKDKWEGVAREKKKKRKQVA